MPYYVCIFSGKKLNIFIVFTEAASPSSFTALKTNTCCPRVQRRFTSNSERNTHPATSDGH